MWACSLWWRVKLLTPATSIWPGRSLRRVSRRPLNPTEDGRAVAADVASLISLPGDPLQVVQAKNMQLRGFVKTLRWPGLASIDVNGRNYELPVTCQSATGAHFMGLGQSARSRYLAGFFDGDGCVFCRTGLSGCDLSVSQSFKQGEVLMLFLSTFGGSVRKMADGVGFRQPALVWRVSGALARSAASVLAPYSITKRKQLELAAAWPEDEHRREACKQQQHALKRTDSAVPGKISMEYLSGFFDAEGYVHHRGGVRLTIEIWQKFGTILMCLQEFLAQDLGIVVHLANYSGFWVLYTGRRSACTAMLHAMLEAGLVGKAEQARLSLQLTAENSSEIRKALAEQVGNQSFGKSLDEDGLQRSRRIANAQKQIKRLRSQGKHSEARAQAEKVEVWQAEHKLLNSRLENQQLREYAAKIQSLHGAIRLEIVACASDCKKTQTDQNGRNGEPCNLKPGYCSLCKVAGLSMLTTYLGGMFLGGSRLGGWRTGGGCVGFRARGVWILEVLSGLVDCGAQQQ